MNKMLVAVFDTRDRGIRGSEGLEGPAQGRRYHAVFIGGDRQGQGGKDQHQAGGR